MSIKKKLLIVALSLFVLIQIALTITIYIVDRNNLIPVSSIDKIRYFGIILCVICSFFMVNKKKSYFLIAGLSFTLLADYILLILDDYYALGISFFIIVQALYFLYVQPKKWQISLLIRGIIFLVAVIVVCFVLEVHEAAAYVAAFYFTNLFCNAVDAYIKDRSLLLFAIGLTLFIGCDVLVAFFNLSHYIHYSSSFVRALVEFSQEGMWLFYLPSQTLIALSPLFQELYLKRKELKSSNCGD